MGNQSADNGGITDEQAMIQYQKTGDEKYFIIIHQRHRKPLHGFVCKYLKDHDEHTAEDVVQATLVRVARFRDTYDGRPFTPWLYSLAAHESVRVIRDRSCNKRGNGRRLAQIHCSLDADDIPAASNSIMDVDDASQLRCLVASLSPPLAAVIQSHYFQGNSIRETAEALGIPEGTVKNRLSRALAMLRDGLESEPTVATKTA